jgi:quinolinate synthase
METIVQRIKRIKTQREALILAHYYETGDIQDIADHVGDSLALAQYGQRAKNPVVLLAGVHFMAESVKILSPEKIVLVPDMNAGCSLVDDSPADKFQKWRTDNPNAIIVTYVNSSAEVKAMSDVICTSSNVEKIVNSIPRDRKIMFAPDRNLGRYIAKKTGREMELWPGSCQVHVLFSAKKLFQLKMEHPDALVIAHPECTDAVLDQADVIGSTQLLLNTTKNHPAKQFIVATEPGILHQMKIFRPDAEFFEAPNDGTCGCNECPFMKLNTMEKIALALETLQPQIQVDPHVAAKARVALDRMMAITDGQDVQWPIRKN